MAEKQLGEGGSCCSVIPDTHTHTHPSPPLFFAALDRGEGQRCLPGQVLPLLASTGSSRAPSTLSPAVLGITLCPCTPATYSSASPVTSWGKRLLVSPCHPSCHGTSGEMLKCWQQWGGRGGMAGQRRSFSNSTPPGHLPSLVRVTGTWGFPVPWRVELSPFTSVMRGPRALAAFQGMVLLSGASNW